MAACVKCGKETEDGVELGIYRIPLESPDEVADVNRTTSKLIPLCDVCGWHAEEFIVLQWNQYAAGIGVV